jgi:hypothetical protein
MKEPGKKLASTSRLLRTAGAAGSLQFEIRTKGLLCCTTGQKPYYYHRIPVVKIFFNTLLGFFVVLVEPIEIPVAVFAQQ